MGIRKIPLAAFLIWTAACGDASTEASQVADDTVVTTADTRPARETKALTDSVIIRFLVSTPGTYGWQTRADNTGLDFFPDGRLHIQGPDGEATMWQGSWSVKEGVLVMDRKDLGVEESFRVVIVGDSLKLGERIYSRYRP